MMPLTRFERPREGRVLVASIAIALLLYHRRDLTGRRASAAQAAAEGAPVSRSAG
jgi:hypothetical protein